MIYHIRNIYIFFDYIKIESVFYIKNTSQIHKKKWKNKKIYCTS